MSDEQSPTPEEIRERCKEIQAEWPEKLRFKKTYGYWPSDAELTEDGEYVPSSEVRQVREGGKDFGSE